MCLLIVVRGLDADYPLLVASNRDEARDRLASPPGLWVGARRRVLSPRDRRAGGTWLGVNDRGVVVGLTNIAGALAKAPAPTRGRLPHLGLDHDDAVQAAAALADELAKGADNPCQIVIADFERIVVLRHRDGEVERLDEVGDVIVVSNEHAPGALRLEGMDAALEPGLDVEGRLAAFRPLLLDEGKAGGHRVLKKGGAWGTVSSSLLAVPRGDMRRLRWLYTPGPPDEVAYRSYGNLGRRLME